MFRSNICVRWFYPIVVILALIVSASECNQKLGEHNFQIQKKIYDYEDNMNFNNTMNHHFQDNYRKSHRKKHRQHTDDISIWINEQQLKMLSGMLKV